MALLAVDIRNDHTVLGLVADGVVEAQWRVSTDQRRTPDEWAVLLRGLLSTGGRSSDGSPDGAPEATPEGIAVSAIVPAVLRTWREMLSAHFPGTPTVVVEPGVRTGLPILLDNPREVGSDRVLAALAALTDIGAPAIVVAVGGTATTFDAINDKGQYVGGAITPGIEISLEALGRRGAQLRQVEFARPRSVIARNTVEAVQSGMLFGAAGAIEGIVSRMCVELASTSPVHVIATGRLAELVSAECTCFTAHSPDLVLRGLELVFRRNA